MSDPAIGLLAAYNAHDPTAAGALYLPGGEHREVAQARTHRGRAQLIAALEHFLAAFADARWEAETTIGSGRLFAIPYRLTGTLSTPLGPFAPAGQTLEIDGVVTVALDAEAGLIARTSDYWDSGTFVAQMKTGRR